MEKTTFPIVEGGNDEARVGLNGSIELTWPNCSHNIMSPAIMSHCRRSNGKICEVRLDPKFKPQSERWQRFEVVN